MDKLMKKTLSERKKEARRRVSFLRQWINEDVVTDNKHLIKNADLDHWLDLEELVTTSYKFGMEQERIAWLCHERCDMCGCSLKGTGLTNTCRKCWEEQ